MTGAELADAIEREAVQRRIPLKVFVGPITRDAAHWMAQLRIAGRPKEHTIARVQALIAGEPVPPPPPNNFQKAIARAAPGHVAGRDPAVPMSLPIPRSTCFRCGVRSDIGCRHTRTEIGA